MVTVFSLLRQTQRRQHESIVMMNISGVRRIDLILVEEAIQYEDREWSRFFTTAKEQPHLPFTAVVADAQQLQPVARCGLCQQFLIRNIYLSFCLGFDST